jgi:hypothetical protein
LSNCYIAVSDNGKYINEITNTHNIKNFVIDEAIDVVRKRNVVGFKIHILECKLMATIEIEDPVKIKYLPVNSDPDMKDC